MAAIRTKSVSTEEEDNTDVTEDGNVTNVDMDRSTNELLRRARQAANLTDKDTELSVLQPRISNSRQRKRTEPPVVDLTCQQSMSKTRRMLPSSIIPKADRPDWLKDNEVLDQYELSEASQLCAQYKMIAAMEKQTLMQEEKAAKSRGLTKQDQEIKLIVIQAGEDDANTNLHPQRFMFRPPITKPETYWEKFPIKWPEVNKRIQLAHLGLDLVLSAKTKELIHDRSDPSISIKMFSNVNVMVGREGGSRTSRVQQCGEYMELESKDNWTELSTMGQLEEALGNLVRAWGAVWPGDYGPSVLQGVMLKHKYFVSSFQHVDTRKKVVENFLDRCLAENATRAGQRLTPLSFTEIETRAKDVVDRRSEVVGVVPTMMKNKNNYNPRHGINGNDHPGHFGSRGSPGVKTRGSNDDKTEFRELLKIVRGHKVDGKDICIF